MQIGGNEACRRNVQAVRALRLLQPECAMKTAANSRNNGKNDRKRRCFALSEMVFCKLKSGLYLAERAPFTVAFAGIQDKSSCFW